MNSAQLTWVAPTTNTDGTPIVGPVTYNLYQGTSPTALTKVLSGLTAITETINSGLSDGTTYYWAVTAVDEGGVESAQSNVVSKTFPAATPMAPTGLTVQ